MGDLFEGLRTVSEFILLGGMITLALAYGFIWIHPIKNILIGYFNESRTFLLGTNSDQKNHADSSVLTRAMVIALTAGSLYFAGSVTNVVGYWVMEPAHNADLARFYTLSIQSEPELCKNDHAVKEEIAWYEWVVFKRLVWARNGSSCEQGTYKVILEDEAFWRTHARESAEDELDSLIKHIRLARGAALSAMLITWLSLLKLFGSLVVWVSASKRLFKALIEPNSEASISKPDVRRLTRRAIVVYLLTAVFGAGLYLVTLKGYLNIEREFHGLARFGASAVKEKLAAEIESRIKAGQQSKSASSAAAEPSPQK